MQSLFNANIQLILVKCLLSFEQPTPEYFFIIISTLVFFIHSQDHVCTVP